MVASFALCVHFVLTKPWHGALTMDSTDGVQKFRTTPTLRIGGVPILLGLILAWSKAPQDVRHTITTILLAGLLAFLFGVGEDITKRLGIFHRLMATMASGLLARWITDYSLTLVDVWGVDWLPACGASSMSIGRSAKSS
jgi:UDP-N-acetylmuramyl pentapeptide phosphotransferase/UDP-N-acetylglucosamine-1-phosphate transferase